MLQPEKLRYEVVPSVELSFVQNCGINHLLRKSLTYDYPGRSANEIERLVQQSATNRQDPNKAVGQGTFRNNQSFARSVSVLAIDQDGELKAQLPVADNASSPEITWLPGIVARRVGLGIGQAKLHIANVRQGGRPLIERRWMWLGLSALSPEARRQIEITGAKEFTVIDGLIAAASLRRDMRQPVSAWPWREELVWRTGLEGAGLRHAHQTQVHDNAAAVDVFGSDPLGVVQDRWTAPNLSHVMETIRAKDGASSALERMAAAPSS